MDVAGGFGIRRGCAGVGILVGTGSVVGGVLLGFAGGLAVALNEDLDRAADQGLFLMPG